jgi:putative membrane protein
LDENSRKFIIEATSGGNLEVKLGNLAQTNGSNPRVKEFGAMMIKDHSDANNQLKNIAQSLNVPVSDSLSKMHQRHVDNLSKKKGAAFDKAYMSMMVNDHKADIKEFEKASKASNTAVSNFASQTLPVLNKHLDSAQAINKKL